MDYFPVSLEYNYYCFELNEFHYSCSLKNYVIVAYRERGWADLQDIDINMK